MYNIQELYERKHETVQTTVNSIHDVLSKFIPDELEAIQHLKEDVYQYPDQASIDCLRSLLTVEEVLKGIQNVKNTSYKLDPIKLLEATELVKKIVETCNDTNISVKSNKMFSDEKIKSLLSYNKKLRRLAIKMNLIDLNKTFNESESDILKEALEVIRENHDRSINEKQL